MQAREQGRETAAEEEGGHEDGVGPVRGVGNGLQAAALVAQLHELGAELEEDDGGDDAGVGVAEGGCCCPGRELENGSDGGHPSDSEARDISANTAGCYGADHSAESEQAYGAAAGMERLSGKVEGHAGPDAHHAAEGAGAAEGVQTHAGMGREYFPDTFDQYRRMRGWVANIFQTLLIRLPYVPLKVPGIRGSILRVRTKQSSIRTAAAMNIVRHPAHWPT